MASASGNGKTTLGRELARRLGVPFVEMDALVHGPGWVDIPDDELRAQVEPIVASDGWVIDGPYRGKLGDLVLARRGHCGLARPADASLAAASHPAHRPADSQGRGALEREQRDARQRALESRLAVPLCVAVALPPPPGLPGGSGASGTWFGCERRPRSSGSSRTRGGTALRELSRSRGTRPPVEARRITVDVHQPPRQEPGPRARPRDRGRGDGSGTLDRTRRQDRGRPGCRRRDAGDARHGRHGRASS